MTQTTLPRGSDIIEDALLRVRRRFGERDVIETRSRLIPESRAKLQACADALGCTLNAALHVAIDKLASDLLDE